MCVLHIISRGFSCTLWNNLGKVVLFQIPGSGNSSGLMVIYFVHRFNPIRLCFSILAQKFPGIVTGSVFPLCIGIHVSCFNGQGRKDPQERAKPPFQCGKTGLASFKSFSHLTAWVGAISVAPARAVRHKLKVGWGPDPCLSFLQPGSFLFDCDNSPSHLSLWRNGIQPRWSLIWVWRQVNMKNVLGNTKGQWSERLFLST